MLKVLVHKKMVKVFENRVLREIFGPTQEEGKRRVEKTSK